MLPKERRISKKNFPYILSESRRYNSHHLLLYLSKIEGGSKKMSQFTFSVSKKVSKLAVNRNRFRRQGYSVVERIPNIKPGYFCFFTFKNTLNLKYSQIEAEIVELLSLSGMLE